MLKPTLCTAIMLLCGACAVAPPPEPVAAVPAVPPECRSITTTATIDGRPQEVKGFACRAADGSWQLTPSLEQPIYLLPPEEYAYYQPAWGWWPLFGPSADFFFVQPHFDHFHRFVRRNHNFMRHEGFPHRMHG